MTDVEELRTCLHGSVLEGRPVEQGPRGTLLIPSFGKPSLLLADWRAARETMPRTGMRPLAVTTDFSGDIELEVGGGSLTPVRHDELDPWQVFVEHPFEDPMTRDDVATYLEAYFPGSSLTSRAAEQLRYPVDWSEVDAWVYRQLYAEPSLQALVADRIAHHVDGRDWFDPTEVVLVMLPDTDPAAPAHYSSYFGADELPDGTEALGRVMRLWNQRWGAETVASWSTMLQLAVARQPASGDQAWELAGQLLRVGTSLQLTRWELALAVERSSTWFLHDRP